MQAKLSVTKMFEKLFAEVAGQLADQRVYDADLSEVKSKVTTSFIRQVDAGDEDIRGYDVTGYAIRIQSQKCRYRFKRRIYGQCGV